MDWKIDWDHAVRRHSEALRGVVAELFVLLGLAGVPRFRGFRPPSTGPCCGCCGRPNPRSAA